MKKALTPLNEGDRQLELERFEVLDTEPEKEFQEIVELAAHITGCKIALVSLVDCDRQWFKARHGLTATETPRDISFCGHAIMGEELFVVPDAELDERFCDNPLFIGEPHVRFYAGMPLVTRKGHRIGTLCVIDSVTRELNPQQCLMLKALAKNVVQLLELRLSNRQLARKAAQFSEVQEITQTGGWEFEISKQELTWSEGVYKIYGVPSGQPLTIELGVSFYAPHEQQRIARLVQRAIDQAEGYDEEFEFKNALGEDRWVRAVARPVLDAQGKVVRLIGTFQDITDDVINRNVRQQALRQLETYGRALNSYAIVAITDVRGIITDINQKFVEISGYTRAELVGQNHRLLNSGHHPKSFFQEMFRVIASGREWRGEIKNRAKDGSFYWVDTTIAPVLDDDDRITGYIAFRYDITARKEAEKLLEASAERFRALFEQNADPLCILSAPDWQFTSMNQRALELFGCQGPEDFVGKTPIDFSPSFQPDGTSSAVAAHERIGRALAEGALEFEWVHRRLDGNELTCLVLLSLVRTGTESYLQASVRDISKLKKNEAELRHSREMLDLALSGASLGIWDWELATNKVYFDQRWAALRGARHEVLKMELSDWADRVHPEDLPLAQERIQQYFEGKTEQYECLHRVRHNEGHWVYILERGRFSDWDQTGKPTRFTGTDLDVSELYRMEEQNKLLLERLKLANDRLSAIVQSTPVGIFECLLDQDWSMVFLSPFIKEITGYESEEFIRNSVRSFASIIHDEDRNYVASEVDRMLVEQGKYDLRYRIRHRDGSLRWIWDRGTVVVDGSHLIGAMSDITDQKERELVDRAIDQLRSRFIYHKGKHKEFFDDLLAIFLKLTDSEYGFVGEVLRDEKGPYLKTYSLTNIAWNEETRKFYQDNVAAGLEFHNLKTLFGEVLLTGKPMITNEAPRHAKAGGIPPGHPPLERFYGIPLFHADQMVGMIAVANRPTGYDEKLYQLQRPLLQVMGEMIYSFNMELELEKQRDAAFHAANLASIGQLAAGVGHEINNPLAIISGQLEVMRARLAPTSEVFQLVQGNLRKADDSIQRIVNIIKGMRSLARNDKGYETIFDLSALCYETFEMLDEIYRHAGVSFEFVGLPTGAVIKGNRTRVQQVLVNMLENAKHATAKSDERKITLKVRHDGDMVVVTIADTGSGIPAENLQKIFTPFFTTKEVGEGTGMGLSLAATILKEHGASWEVESQVGVGTRFLLSFPSAKPAAEAKSATASPPVTEPVDPRAKGPRVLVVDDEPDLCEVLEMILRPHCASLRISSSPIEALEIIQAGGIDLVFSDVRMPKMDGFAFLRELRSRSLPQQPRFVFVCGDLEFSPEQQTTFDAHAQGVIRKPFSREKILALLKEIGPA